MKKFKKDPKYIILHTAAFKGEVDVDIIRDWHLARGFDDIGYHFLVRGSWFDSSCEVQEGRSLEFQGAHALGYNYKSIGVCASGSGDDLELTGEQMYALAVLVIGLMSKYEIPINRVIGHKDTFLNKLNPRKTCPGKLVDMEEIRKYILQVKRTNSSLQG